MREKTGVTARVEAKQKVSHVLGKTNQVDFMLRGGGSSYLAGTRIWERSLGLKPRRKYVHEPSYIN